MPRGFSGCGYGVCIFFRHTAGVQTRPKLSCHSKPNGIIRYLSLRGESTSQDGPTAMRTSDERGSKCRSMMEQIPVATITSRTTGRESGLTFFRCLTRESLVHRWQHRVDEVTRDERVIATLIERPAFPVVDHVVNQRPVGASEILTDSPAE